VRFGVGNVSIIHIFGTSVVVFRQPLGCAYFSCEQRTGGILSRALVSAVVIDVAALVT